MPLPPGTLGQALDQLPQLLLTLGKLQQDRRDEEVRRDIQQARFDFEREMLTKRIAAEEVQKGALEQIRRETGAFDPPEVAIIGRRIEKDLDILRDPNTPLTLGAEEINAVKARVTSNLAEIRRQSGREYYVDPSLLELTAPPSPPPAAAPPPVEDEKPRKKKFFAPARVYGAYRPEALTAPAVEPAVEGIPPGFPDPSGFPEGQTATFNGDPWIIRSGQWVEDK